MVRGRIRRSSSSWIADHIVEVAFGVLVVAAFVYQVRVTRASYFWTDEWRLVRQAGSFRGLVEPYNGHLSIIILTSYRFSAQLFGFDYLPIRIIGTGVLVGLPVAYFFTTRRQLGPPLAALLAISLLWFAGPSLNQSEMNHYLALIGGIGCAAALNRGRRADPWLGGALLLALASAGGGVAVAAGCLVHNAMVRPHLRRWIVVIAPSALWGTWWLMFARDERVSLPVSRNQAFSFVRDLISRTFESLAFGSSAIAILLMIGFVGLLLWHLGHGLDAAANIVAWSTALVAWGTGLAYSRSILADPDVFRYQLVTAGFVLLAIVPRKPIRWPTRFPLATNRRLLAAAAILILVFGGIRGLSLRSDMQTVARERATIGQLTRGETLAIGLRPEVVPDDLALNSRFGQLTSGQVRSLLDRYGRPFPATPTAADRELVDTGLVTATLVGRGTFECRPSDKPFSVPRLAGFFLWSDQDRWTIDVRRFGDEWVPLASPRGGQIISVTAGFLASDVPWEIRADAACRVTRP